MTELKWVNLIVCKLCFKVDKNLPKHKQNKVNSILQDLLVISSLCTFKISFQEHKSKAEKFPTICRESYHFQSYFIKF